MRLMNEVLKYSIGKFLVLYLDDIIIFKMSKEEHLEYIIIVLYKLKE